MLDIRIKEVENGFIISKLTTGRTLNKVSLYKQVGVAKTVRGLVVFIRNIQKEGKNDKSKG